MSVGRSYRDAPEVDGLVLVKEELPLGDMVLVLITGAMEYDLIGVRASGASGPQPGLPDRLKSTTPAVTNQEGIT